MITQYTVIMVKIIDLKPASYNPHTRTSRSNLKTLKDSIIRAGGILVPILITKDLEIIDGHRRVACAVDLGWDEVPAIICDSSQSRERTWMLINGGSRKMTPGEMMQAYKSGYPIDLIPQPVRHWVKTLEEACGKELFMLLCERGLSPAIYGNARRISNYCNNDTKEFLYQIILWFVTNNQQFAARRFMDADQPPNVIHDAIVNNRPLVHRWG